MCTAGHTKKNGTPSGHTVLFLLSRVFSAVLWRFGKFLYLFYFLAGFTSTRHSTNAMI